MGRFEEYIRELQATEHAGEEGDEAFETIQHLDYLLDLVRAEHRNELAALASLLSEQQITFEYIWGVFTPGSILLTHCETTGEPLLLRLRTCTLQARERGPYWKLRCEYVDVSSGLPGLVEVALEIEDFSGAESITDLPVFPIHPWLGNSGCKELREALLARGKRSWELTQTWRHKVYDGVATHFGRKLVVRGPVGGNLESNGIIMMCTGQIQDHA